MKKLLFENWCHAHWRSTGAAEALAQEQVIQLLLRPSGQPFRVRRKHAGRPSRPSYDAGLRGFETDIRMTRDGELVILARRDAGTSDACKRVVETMTADEIRRSRPTGQTT